MWQFTISASLNGKSCNINLPTKLFLIKAAILKVAGQLELKEVHVPEPEPREVQVKLTMTGICGSDVHLFRGNRSQEKSVIPGHEGIGIIVKCGTEVKHLTVGERVVIEPNFPCFSCQTCLSGHSTVCPKKGVLGLNKDGCFAQFVNVPAKFCWKIPDTISDIEAVCIEPAAVGVHALRISKVNPNDTIAVVGLGAIGLLITHIAISLGHKVIAYDIDESKMKKAEELGALVPGNRSPNLGELWELRNVRSIYECTGNANAVKQCLEEAPAGATVILLGLDEATAEFSPLHLVRRGITIIPSLIYEHPTDFETTLLWVQEKKIFPSKIISKKYPLSEIQEAMQKAVSGTESKIIILNQGV